METVVDKEATIQEEHPSSKNILCAHCATPVPSSEKSPAFCCKGCEFVYHSLRGLGLHSFYAYRGDDTGKPAIESSPARDYDYLDQYQVQEKFVHHENDGTHRIEFYLSGIHCAACIWLLEKLPEVTKGIQSARVNFGSGQISIEYFPDAIKLSRIAQLLNSLGYPPVPVTAESISSENRREERQALIRIGVAALCAANTQMLAVSLFQGYFTGIEEPYGSLFRWLSALLATPAVLYAAIPFYRSAISSLYLGVLHIDLPIAIAIIGTYLAGILNCLNGNEYVYFDSVTTLIFLLLSGRWIQRRAVHRSRASSRSAWDLFPSTVRIVSNGSIVQKPIVELQVDDVIEIKPSERVAADGIVLSGSSSIDSSFLTGESIPQPLSEGSHILAGALNLDGTLQVRVSSIGTRTRLGKILEEVGHAHSEKTPIESEANRLAGYFVGGVLLLALLAYGSWHVIDPSKAFDVTVALLIVTCPCALGLAVPATISVSLARAQQQGIFFKKPDGVETLAKISHFYFDKTGTLTGGKLTVQATTSIDDYPGALAVALARQAPFHPISSAIIRNGTNPNTSEPILFDAKYLGGKGVAASLSDGTRVSLGSIKWFQEEKMSFSDELLDYISTWSAQGLSVVGLARSGIVIGLFGLADEISSEAFTVISLLKELGKVPFILSGDSQEVVDAVAQKLGIPPENAHGNLYPEEKAAIVTKDTALKAVIGDGVNDAGAMRASNLGVGIRGGIEATLEVADLFISEGGIGGFEVALRGSIHTLRVIRGNLLFSATYNILGAVGALFGIVNPLVAAILMPSSSLSVILAATLSKPFQKR